MICLLMIALLHSYLFALANHIQDQRSPMNLSDLSKSTIEQYFYLPSINVLLTLKY